MKLDSIALSSVTFEIKERLIPAKIIELYQLSKYEILLLLKRNNHIGKLFCSIRPDRMAFFLSDSSLPSKNFSSLFFNQLQNWVQGGTLLDIEHYQFDRIIKLIIRPYNKFGEPKQYQLIIEFMGKHSNIILIDEHNIIKAALKQVGSEVNRYREVKAGISYVYPPRQDKSNPLTISRQNFMAMISDSKNSANPEYLWQFFLQNFIGLGEKSSKEIVVAMNLPLQQKLEQITEDRWPDLWNNFSGLRQKMIDNEFSPQVLIDKESNKVIDYFLLCPVNEQQNIMTLPFEKTSPCLEFIFKRLTEEDKKQNLYHAINKVLKKNIKKLAEKERFFRGKKREIENCEEYKKKGELIKANLWNINPGTREITIIDYTDAQQPKITVNLNPDITPLQNAKNYFKKYKKTQQNRDAVEKQARENQNSLQQLKEIQKKMAENRNSLEELSVLYDRLVKLGYIKKEKDDSAKRKAEQGPAISKFLSPDGWTILAGKNNKQNEYILRYLSSGNDFWLHNLTRPGGHVIIKNHKNMERPPHSTLVFAARLAAFYSKTKDKENTLIIYTQRKYVRKAKDSKMGKVIYSNEKTIPIETNHNEIKKDIQRMLVS